MQTVKDDVVDGIRMALVDGTPASGMDEGLAVLEARLERVRLLGGRFALVGVSPQVAGMLKAVGRARLSC